MSTSHTWTPEVSCILVLSLDLCLACHSIDIKYIDVNVLIRKLGHWRLVRMRRSAARHTASAIAAVYVVLSGRSSTSPRDNYLPVSTDRPRLPALGPSNYDHNFRNRRQYPPGPVLRK